MRFLLALMTLGAAGAGYAYLYQPPNPQAAEAQTALRPLFDWGLSDAAPPRVADDARDLIASDAVDDQTSTVMSALDDFVEQNDEAEAVTRLKDVAPSSSDVVGMSNTDELAHSAPPSRDVDEDEAPVDALTAATPDPISSEPAQEVRPANTPGASVREATIVRTEKPEPANTDQKKAEPYVADAAIAQVAAKEANEVATRAKIVERKPALVSDWKVASKTTEGRPVHTRRYGDSGTRTLVIAGLDGEDRIAVRWIDQLAEDLVERSELFQSNEVLIFRAGNPDGLTKKTAENAHGVLINKNFPSRRYRPLPDMSSGRGPATEAETRAILDVLYSFHPRRVIHLTATSAPSRVLYNRLSREVAGDLQRSFNLDVHPLDVEQYPGSLEDFSDGTLEAGVLTMQLNVGKDWQQAWPKHQSVVLTAMSGRVIGKSNTDDELARSSPDLDRTQLPVSKTEPASPRKSRRGYEELPAPPR